MSDAPENAAAPAELTDLERIERVLEEAAQRYVLAAHAANPEARPIAVVTDILLSVGRGCIGLTSEDTVRSAFLGAFTYAHDDPPSFIAIGQAKKTLEQFSSAYRKLRRSASPIIDPTTTLN